MLPNITRLLVFVAILIALWGAGVLEYVHYMLYEASMFAVRSVYDAFLALAKSIVFEF